VYSNVFTRLRPLKAPALAWPPFSGLSIDMEARPGLRVWWIRRNLLFVTFRIARSLAAEIHDALAQSFTGISMQLGVAEEQLAAKEGDLLRQIQLANEIAKFGLAEARRSILSLRSSPIEESGLTATLQRLVEHSNVAAQLRCDFRSDNIPEERLPQRIQHELLRFAQEAISNVVRHAKPTVVSVTLRWEPPNLILKVKDNGSGISGASLEKSEGFGLGNMRTRASQIDGKLDIQTTAGHGTSIILTVPIPS